LRHSNDVASAQARVGGGLRQEPRLHPYEVDVETDQRFRRDACVMNLVRVRLINERRAVDFTAAQERGGAEAFLEAPRQLEPPQIPRLPAGFGQLRRALPQLRQEIVGLVGAQFPSARGEVGLERGEPAGILFAARFLQVVQLEPGDQRVGPVKAVREVAVPLRKAFVRLLRCLPLFELAGAAGDARSLRARAPERAKSASR